jgi:hypothetical protein
MLNLLLVALLSANPPAAKLDSSVRKEMARIIVTVNKALGLESWKGPEVCVDWGGLEALIKSVSPEDTRTCAASAVTTGFPGLGKDYTLGIVMADIGPVTVFAIGKDAATGWGAYSCDYTRKCNPTKLNASSKAARRLMDRFRRACAQDKTVWLPERGSVCDAL